MKFKIIRYKNIKSTQIIANNLAKKGMKEGVIILTEKQSCGKGRNNNNWFSPKGGLWLSIILRPKNKINFTQLFGLIIAYLISLTIKDITKIRTTIKLPNDILINKKKVCGILVDSIFKGNKIDYMIIGIGININFRTKILPKEIISNSTTLRDEYGKEIDIDEFLSKLLDNFNEIYQKLITQPRTALKEITNHGLRNKLITIRDKNKTLLGKLIELKYNNIEIELPSKEIKQYDYKNIIYIE